MVCNLNPLVSVVTVCYNAVHTIESTILSVLDQSYSNIDYIIIDGGSTDGTVDVIQKYSDRLAYWVSEPDHGIYDAMNKGILKSTGSWIIFMNSGDLFYDRSVLKSVFDEEIPITYDVIYGNRLARCFSSTFKQYPLPLCQFSRDFPIFHQSTFIRNEAMKRYLYDTSFKICADYDFFHKLWVSHHGFLYKDIVISNCDCEFGISSLVTSEVLRVKEGERIRNGSISFLSYCKLAKVYLVSSIYFHWSKYFPASYAKNRIRSFTNNNLMVPYEE